MRPDAPTASAAPRGIPAALLAVIAVSALLAGCAGDRAGAFEVARSDAPRATAVIEARDAGGAAVRAFATDLYAVLAREDGNIVFSPYSAAVALAMTRAGAEGETAAQMDAALHTALAGDLHAAFNALDQALAERPGEYPLDGDGTAELILATANSLWAQRDFEFHAAYLDRLAAQYGAGVRLVDYVAATEDARRAINDWVAEQTRDRIPELIPQGVLDAMTRLVLTNAIYLKAPWLHRFDDGATAPGPFTRLDGARVEAQLMRLGERLRYGAGDGYQAVELPYIGGELSMLVVVPDAGEFAAFESGLDAARLGGVVGSLGDAQVNLSFPRFEFRSQALLKPALSELGMPIAFTESADFSGMSPAGRDMYIQEVIHEAFISVDEQGTEAAAATAVVVGVTSAPAVTVDLVVDRPFLFLIRDAATGAVLFMGRVVDPTE